MYILYTGEDLVIRKAHHIWGSMTALYKNRIYKLEHDWNGQEINGYWMFYIYDDLPAPGSRGYEILIKDVKPLREYNLEKLISN